MLAPMQGLTNHALRSLFIERVHPDVVFTEFVRARACSKKIISNNDCLEAASRHAGAPLVVQLIGADTEAMVKAACTVLDLGAEHININLGCPYTRMTGSRAGGNLLPQPAELRRLLSRLRQCINGGFSVKARAGFDDPSQLFSLLHLFEDCGVDFLIVHPRTVQEGYRGRANHEITAEVVRQTTLPVIANGDVFTAADGREVLDLTGAAGLMLGRGAIADPFLFERIRGRYPAVSEPEKRAAELRGYLQDLLERYREIFCGEQQILGKMKEVLAQIHEPDLAKPVKQLRKCKKMSHFTEMLAAFP